MGVFLWARYLCGFKGARSRVQGPGFRVQGSGFRVQGSGLKWAQTMPRGSFEDAKMAGDLLGLGFWVWGLGCRVQGLECWF